MSHPLLTRVPASAALAALVLGYLPGIAAPDTMLLRPHWEPGKTYRQETTTEMQIDVPGSANADGQRSRVTQTLAISVTRAPGADRKLAKVSFTSILATVGLSGQVTTYDSADPAKAPPFLQQTFGALMGRSFTLAYDREDRFLEVLASDGSPATPLGTTTAPDARQLADAFRKSLELALPPEAVAVGDTWDIAEKLDLPPAGTVTAKAKGRFDCVLTVEGRRHEKLLFDGVFQSPAAAGQLVQVHEGSKFSGEVLFDLERKLVTSSVARTELKLTLGGRAASLRQTIAMRLTDTVAGK